MIAAGTGMGQAYLHRVEGGWQPVPTEAGHADFAARTDRELELVRMLRERYGRAEVEQVISGQGLLNLHRFTHRGGECQIVPDLESPVAPALVSQAALGGRCQSCAEALRMFVSAYGAEAGNLALRTMATAGVYIGGGIARKILPALTNGGLHRGVPGQGPAERSRRADPGARDPQRRGGTIGRGRRRPAPVDRLSAGPYNNSAKNSLTIRRSGSITLSQSPSFFHRSPYASATCCFVRNGL